MVYFGLDYATSSLIAGMLLGGLIVYLMMRIKYDRHKNNNAHGCEDSSTNNPPLSRGRGVGSYDESDYKP